VNIVWLKRDLRTSDHEALFQAENQKEDYLIVYLFEPSLILHKDVSERHLQFVYHSLLNMNRFLKPANRRIQIFHGEAKEVFEFLISKYKLKNVFSHQESGTKITWNRDKNISSLFKKKGVKWEEFQTEGIIRGINNRVGWDKRWYIFANQEIFKNKFSKCTHKSIKSPFDFNIKNFPFLLNYPAQFQPAGESYAMRYLKSFIDERAKNYSRQISSPQKSSISCGRLSPYFAWGNLSVRVAYQAVRSAPNYLNQKRAYDSFLSRLKWRSHFIQKFEVDCTYESNCINKGYEKMSYKNNDILLEKWKAGETGFPLVDASMRCLQHKGWLNFRMRAMLVSFLCHYLDQDWKRGVYHMARLFLDYEPGIHFTQFQMQAGVTGINSIRIYNPVKQSIEKDSDGVFVRNWVPELRDLPLTFIHQPWKLTPIDLLGGQINLNYPAPLVNPEKTKLPNRDKLWALKKDPEVKKESLRLLGVHVRPQNPEIKKDKK
jgi:deoxyribodipyrimidine photo-lyase